MQYINNSMGITKTDLFSVSQNNLAKMAKALAHPARISIIEHLLKTSSCVNGDLVEETGLAQATISQHLRELKEIGIIQGTIEGTSVCYCINPEKWEEIKSDFNNLFNQYKPTTSDCC